VILGLCFAWVVPPACDACAATVTVASAVIALGINNLRRTTSLVVYGTEKPATNLWLTPPSVLSARFNLNAETARKRH
jgi:hypothetical protein